MICKLIRRAFAALRPRPLPLLAPAAPVPCISCGNPIQPRRPVRVGELIIVGTCSEGCAVDFLGAALERNARRNRVTAVQPTASRTPPSPVSVCPGPGCSLCNGDACTTCQPIAGAPRCTHNVQERHRGVVGLRVELAELVDLARRGTPN